MQKSYVVFRQEQYLTANVTLLIFDANQKCSQWIYKHCPNTACIDRAKDMITQNVMIIINVRTARLTHRLSELRCRLSGNFWLSKRKSELNQRNFKSITTIKLLKHAFIIYRRIIYFLNIHIVTEIK